MTPLWLRVLDAAARVAEWWLDRQESKKKAAKVDDKRQAALAKLDREVKESQLAYKRLLITRAEMAHDDSRREGVQTAVRTMERHLEDLERERRELR